MKNLYWIVLIFLVVFLFTPFREDLRICKVYDSDYKRYEYWEQPMIIGLRTFPNEESANIPFSIIGSEEESCYLHKWYQSLDGLNLINKPINNYSFIDKLIYALTRPN
jgi:hypothetical protein